MVEGDSVEEVPDVERNVDESGVNKEMDVERSEDHMEEDNKDKNNEVQKTEIDKEVNKVDEKNVEGLLEKEAGESREKVSECKDEITIEASEVNVEASLDELKTESVETGAMDGDGNPQESKNVKKKALSMEKSIGKSGEEEVELKDGMDIDASEADLEACLNEQKAESVEAGDKDGDNNDGVNKEESDDAEVELVKTKEAVESQEEVKEKGDSKKEKRSKTHSKRNSNSKAKSGDDQATKNKKKAVSKKKEVRKTENEVADRNNEMEIEASDVDAKANANEPKVESFERDAKDDYDKVEVIKEDGDNVEGEAEEGQGEVKMEDPNEGKGSHKNSKRKRIMTEKGADHEANIKKKSISKEEEPKTPGVTLDRPVRERKSVERLVASIDNESFKEFRIEKGRGTALKDIPNVAFKLSRKKSDDNIKLLHSILFSKRGKAAELKSHVLRFSGFVWHQNETREKNRLKEKLDKCAKEKVVELCEVLDMPILKTNFKKEDAIVKLMDFLETPHVTTSELLSEKDQSSKGKKRKRGSTSSIVGCTSSKQPSKSKKGKENDCSKGVSEEEKEDEEEKNKGKDDTENTNKLLERSADEMSVESQEDKGKVPESESQGKVKGKEIESSELKKEKGKESKRDANEDKGKESKIDANEEKGKEKVVVSKKKKKKPAKKESEEKSKTEVTKKTSSKAKLTKGKESESDSKEEKVKESKNEPKEKKENESESESKDEEEKQKDVSKKESIKAETTKKATSKAKSTPSNPKASDGSKGNNVEGSNRKTSSKKRQPPIPKKSAGKKVDEGKSMSVEAGLNPSDADIKQGVCQILKEVDFNTATFTDILNLLGTRLGVDLTPRKSSIKLMVQDELTRIAEEDDDE